MSVIIAGSMILAAAHPPARAEPGRVVCAEEGKVVAPGTRDRCCWPGQRWLPKDRRCAGAPSACPPDFHADGERCVLDELAFSRYLRETIRRGLPALRRCYDRALHINPALSVRTGPRFTIASDGTVKNVVLDPALPPPLAQCVTAAIRGWRFPPIAGEIQISYPLHVDPAD